MLTNARKLQGKSTKMIAQFQFWRSFRTTNQPLLWPEVGQPTSCLLCLGQTQLCSLSWHRFNSTPSYFQEGLTLTINHLVIPALGKLGHFAELKMQWCHLPSKYIIKVSGHAWCMELAQTAGQGGMGSSWAYFFLPSQSNMLWIISQRLSGHPWSFFEKLGTIKM